MSDRTITKAELDACFKKWEFECPPYIRFGQYWLNQNQHVYAPDIFHEQNCISAYTMIHNRFVSDECSS